MNERIQSAIDAALEELRDAKPAPDFLPRLRERVEQQSRSAWSSRWRVRAALAMTALLVLAIAITSRPWSRPWHVAPSAVSNSVSVASPRGSTGMPNAGEGAAPGRAQSDSIARNHRRVPLRAAAAAPITHKASDALEVIVPDDERRAIGKWLDAFRSGRPAAISPAVDIAAADADGPSTSSELTVAPIRIEPVVVSPFPAVAAIVDK